MGEYGDEFFWHLKNFFDIKLENGVKRQNAQKGEKILKKIKACYMMEGQNKKEGFI